MYIYKILKPILGFIYKLWYNPKIIGKENIKDEGSLVVVGNHYNIMDQCNIIIPCKRVIHYMAKDEYFKSNKTRWFFKSMGCIPVDRTKKDESAKKSALEVLNKNEVLGLFPEGTRNALKDDKIKNIYKKYNIKEDYNIFKKKLKKIRTSQILYLEELIDNNKINASEFIDNIYNPDLYLKKLVKDKIITNRDYQNSLLLPFKFGAVSLASKTDSYILPFAIKGDYKFRSKNLEIRIGKCYKIKDDLEKENKKLRKKIIDLLMEDE